MSTRADSALPPAAAPLAWSPLLAELIVVDDPTPHPAALNMALDEVLLAGLGGTSLLRCYRWSRPAVSFGCFGQYATVRTAFPEVEHVRRWTGGGLVEHGADFTYTLLVPRSLPLAAGPAAESYRLIHATVAQALRALGWSGIEIADPADGRSVSRATAGSPPFLQPCFTNPVAADLLVAGGKIAGGAQRRTRRGLLHQGSIQRADLGAAAANLAWQGYREKLAAAFSREATMRTITDSELAAAQHLAAIKYAAPAWTERF